MGGAESRSGAWSGRWLAGRLSGNAPLRAVFLVSMANVAYQILRVLLTVVLAGPGLVFLVGFVNGPDSVPAPLRYSEKNGKDKIVEGAKLVSAVVSFPVTAAQLLCLIGFCKVFAAVSFWLPALRRVSERATTFLAALLYVCVAAGHRLIDGDFVAPLVLAALALVKLLVHPAGKKKAKAM